MKSPTSIEAKFGKVRSCPKQINQQWLQISQQSTIELNRWRDFHIVDEFILRSEAANLMQFCADILFSSLR